MVDATVIVRIARPTAEQPDLVAQDQRINPALMQPVYDNRRCRLDA